jgi:hypothetical protein
VTSATSGIGQRIEPVDLGVRERFPSLSQFEYVLRPSAEEVS